jgi:UDP-glucose 4-epimerase
MPLIKNNRFVVVGGASLLGSHIGRQLLDGGASEVALLDNLFLGSKSTIDDLLLDKRAEFVRADMTKLHELIDPLSGAAGVFSVAGFLGGPMLNNPWMGLDVNIRGIQNLLEACRVQKVQKVLFSSSMGVYGKITPNAGTENAPFAWDALPPGLILYSGSKIIGEGLCRLYQQNYGIDCVSLRYSNLYGENQHKRSIDGNKIVSAWERIRSGKAPIIEGDGKNVADFIYVGDVARANLMSMEGNATGSFNIVSGHDTSFNELINALLVACKSNLSPEYKLEESGIANPIVTSLKVSREKAKHAFGWEPQVDICEGMKRLVAWLDMQS